jgi:hypothetical protein
MNERDVLELLSDIKVEQAKQGVRLDTYNEHLKDHMKRSDNLEKQVAELYKWKSYMAGALALTSIMGAVVLQLITMLFGDK